MSKPTLVRMSWTDLNSSYLEWILQEYFTLETYNLNKTYDRESTIFVVSLCLLLTYLNDYGCEVIWYIFFCRSFQRAF